MSASSTSMALVPPQPPAVVVVLDGANVARQKDGVTCIPKLAAAINYFRSSACAGGRFPVKCVAFVPNFWLHAKPGGSGSRETDELPAEDRALLQRLVDDDRVTLTPSQAHDDFYVIDYAVKYDGFIVTNDMFRDHVADKRVFHGQRLTRTWVKDHCIDFTFVGPEFMPNPTAMARVFAFDPTTVSMAPAPVSPTAAKTRVKGGIGRSLFTEGEAAAAEAAREEDAGGEQDDMDVDGARRKKHIDLSEVTHYRLPRDLLPVLHGQDGDTMDKFQEFTGTYIVLPSIASVASVGAAGAVTLSIYGPESNRQRAVAQFDQLLASYQAATYQSAQEVATRYYHHQQQQQQQLYQPQQFVQHPSGHALAHGGGYVSVPPTMRSGPSGGAPDDQMMDVDS